MTGEREIHIEMEPRFTIIAVLMNPMTETKEGGEGWEGESGAPEYNFWDIIIPRTNAEIPLS